MSGCGRRRRCGTSENSLRVVSITEQYSESEKKRGIADNGKEEEAEAAEEEWREKERKRGHNIGLFCRVAVSPHLFRFSLLVKCIAR